MIGMEISDLVQMMNQGSEERTGGLSEAQEREIVQETELLLISPNLKWRDNGPIQRFFQENERYFLKNRKIGDGRFSTLF